MVATGDPHLERIHDERFMKSFRAFFGYCFLNWPSSIKTFLGALKRSPALFLFSAFSSSLAVQY